MCPLSADRSPPLHDTCCPCMIHTKNSKKGPKIKDLTPIWDPWYNGGSIIRRTKWKIFYLKTKWKCSTDHIQKPLTMLLNSRSLERMTHGCICIVMQNMTISSILGRGATSRSLTRKKALSRHLVAHKGLLDPRTFSEVRGFFCPFFAFPLAAFA